MQIFDSGIVLFAKKSGKTSFSSLWDIKHALKTKKVGHTGTLDSFADGLLVVLFGSMTRLVSHVTNFNKTYEAIICFGQETDTLDPSGEQVKTAPLPSKEELECILPQFLGEQLQVPPSYSAVHINGKRASDLAREGKDVEIKARPVTIYSLDLVSTDSVEAVKYAHIRVSVSKGTYIRSLARDIAYACSSCAHLIKLRRTHVGPFSLADACFSSELEEFSLSMLNHITSFTNETELDQEINKSEKSFTIQKSVFSLTAESALQCGFSSVVLKKEYEDDFFHGRPLFDFYFNMPLERGEYAVFLESAQFCGMVEKKNSKILYSFVIPKNNELRDTVQGKV